MKDFSSTGCLRIVRATISQCFTEPKRASSMNTIDGRIEFAKDGRLISLWSHVCGKDTEALKSAIVNFNKKLLAESKVIFGEQLDFYIETYGSNK